MELTNVSWSWDLNEKKKALLHLLVLFGVLKIKDDLDDRTDMKKLIKMVKKLHVLECGPGCTSLICNN